MTTEEKIWAYLDGKADEATRQWVEEKRINDPVFRVDFAERELLHRRLRQLPLAAPSMRFAQNVMDRLPAVAVPFIPPQRLQAFWRTAFLLVLTYFGAALLLGDRPTDGGSMLGGLIDRFLQSLPPSTLEIAAALGLGFILLYLADRYLSASSSSSRS